MEHYDIIIIGGGILGTFHAYHALEKGQKVALLEKNSHPKGSTVQNFGQIVPSGLDTKWQAYGRKSLEIYKSIHEKFDITVRQNGSVYLASDAEEMSLLEELAVINRSNDYSSHLLTAAECCSRYPGLRSDYCMGGLFFPEEITLEPRTAIHRIREYLMEQKGLHYFPKTLAIAAETSGEHCRVAAADGRVFYGEQVVICSGYEFQTLFPEIFTQSDLEAVKLQMILLEKQPTQVIPGSVLTGLSIRRYESFRECPSYSAIKQKESNNSLAKKWGVHILFKQAADGSVILGDSHEYADAAAADTLGPQINEEINLFMLNEAAKIFQLQNWNIRETWSGMYAQSKTGDLFRHTIDDRIHIVTGIGGKGMTATPGLAMSYER